MGAREDRSDNDNDIGVMQGRQHHCRHCHVVGCTRTSTRVRAHEDGSDDDDDVVARGQQRRRRVVERAKIE